jgi:hypothetical protein
MQHFEIWQQRPVIINHRIVLIPPLAGPLTTSVSGLHPQNKYHGKLLNQWRAAKISMVLDPFTGPSEPNSTNRFNYAIDICRTYAALDVDMNVAPQWKCLLHAGQYKF